MNGETGFYWQQHPAAEALFIEHIEQCGRNSPLVAALCGRMAQQISTKMLDWIDHILVPEGAAFRERLAATGFIRQETEGPAAFYHPGARLPRVVVDGSLPDGGGGIALRVESIPGFLQANGLKGDIEGTPFGAFRRCLVDREGGVSLQVVERRCGWTFDPADLGDDWPGRYVRAAESWQQAPRILPDQNAALAAMIATAEDLIRSVGRDMAAHIILEVERQYWMARNHAARVQKGRQDTMGLGWANHDHHTFRSSRRHFTGLVRLFKLLGFQKRERFYAGEDAGWGAQLMENPNTGFVLFLDVDLTPDEVAVDFAEEELPESEDLGTVGLWCALHGDSILGAGMHHLAAGFLFETLPEDLDGTGVTFMAPFSNFPYLKQAFSTAETWQVDQEKVERLVASKRIDRKKADVFLRDGAIGSHLENIERREGYKGFNKKNVSAIIRGTDPRAQGG